MRTAMGINLLPYLRFPEFSKHWQTTEISKLANSVVPGRNKPKRFNGDIPWITLPDLHDTREIFSSKGNLFLSKEEIQEIGTKIVPARSVIMSCVGELGVSSVVLREVVINQQLHAYIPTDSIDSYFLKYLIQTRKKYLYTRATKTSVLYLNKENCDALPVAFPEVYEQQKIADFLSAVDDKIRLLKEKHALLQQYKKGVMQKLFSQEIRFKDDNGQAFADWDVISLSKLAKKCNNKNANSAVRRVLTNSAKSGIVPQGDYFNKDIANQGNLEGYTVVQLDDFVYNPRISELAPVGPIGRNHVGEGVMSPLYTVFRLDNKELFDFVEKYFSTSQWHRYMYSIANFGARHDRMNISSADFYSLPIPVPSEPERVKIVEFVNTLETKVGAVQQQIDLIQTFKKGLLQQMFV